MDTMMIRPRRLRTTASIRDLVREHRVHPSQLVLPLFLVDGQGDRMPVRSMPGVDRMAIDPTCKVIEEARMLGIGAFALFPCIAPEDKDRDGSCALRRDSLMCRSFGVLRERFPDATLIADIALDPYSTDGHDGIVRNGEIRNDETVDVLSKQAVLLAQAGASVVAPSDMMDGRIGAIRAALESAHLSNTVIMSYTAKYASSFYGPFRHALESTPVPRPGVPKDKRTYQMDPANGREAMRQAALDVDEGADILLVKPGLPYLDIIHRFAEHFDVPIAAYHVSGEYAMLRAASERGCLDYDASLAETLTCFARAGARIIFTYGAVDYARRYREEAGGD